MGKAFRPSNREASILSKIESSKNYGRRKVLYEIKNCAERLSNSIAMKLVDFGLIETTSKNVLEEQIAKCLDKLSRAAEFDIEYQISPFKKVAKNPHIVSLYITAFVIEQLINNKAVVDIYGTDAEIYNCINSQVRIHLTV